PDGQRQSASQGTSHQHVASIEVHDVSDSCLFTLFFQDALRIKRPCAGRETQTGRWPGEASQRRAWPFWLQPDGNGLDTAPLVVALPGQTYGLAVVTRPDGRCVQPIRTW